MTINIQNIQTFCKLRNINSINIFTTNTVEIFRLNCFPLRISNNHFYFMNTIRITALFIYPIKSLGGIPLADAPLTHKGLRHDRQWMVVREDGRFVTQRDSPRIALVKTSFVEDGVELSLDGHGTITVPFELFHGENIETAVWRVKCQGMDQGDDVSDWLTRSLESKERLRLVRMAPGFRRPQNKPDIMGEDTTVDFADAAPLLVANEASLAGLSAGSFQLRLRAPCERCAVTTIDQETAEKDSAGQPFKTLQDINPIPGKPQAPAFGQYATVIHDESRTIKVGDCFEPIVNPPF